MSVAEASALVAVALWAVRNRRRAWVATAATVAIAVAAGWLAAQSVGLYAVLLVIAAGWLAAPVLTLAAWSRGREVLPIAARLGSLRWAVRQVTRDRVLPVKVRVRPPGESGGSLPGVGMLVLARHLRPNDVDAVLAEAARRTGLYPLWVVPARWGSWWLVTGFERHPSPVGVREP